MSLRNQKLIIPAIPRCITCGYVLTGLESSRCPECGREFNPSDPATFSFRPPYLPNRYWMPGVLLAGAIAIVMGVALAFFGGYGVALSIVLPICIGTVMGYGLSGRIIVRALLAILVIMCVAITLFSMSLAGVFCGTCLFIVMLVPTLLGVFFGSLLRWRLKSTQWDQRWHLPVFVLIFVPLLCAGIERLIFPHPYAVEEVRTSVDLPVEPHKAWNGMMFYEQVRLPAPWLLRYALPKPLYTIGPMNHVGDKKICVYTKGRLVKYISAISADHRLDFAVIEQTHIENRSVRLMGGSFIFTPIDADHTRITLSTRYEPLLAPRWAWQPFEELGISKLHQFVLQGMAQQSEEPPSGKAQ